VSDEVWGLTKSEWETLRDLLKKLVEGPHGMTIDEHSWARHLVCIAEDSLDV
jgi:hypothetical protein